MKNKKTEKISKNETGSDSIEKLLELENKLARSLADYSNLEKRIENQRQMFVTLATTAILSRMVEVLDDLYLAQNHLKDQGLQMAIDKFTNVLKSEGLEEIKTEGEFNPETMDCVQAVPGEDDQVVEVKKKGYKLNGQVIRPAQVTVGKQN